MEKPGELPHMGLYMICLYSLWNGRITQKCKELENIDKLLRMVAASPPEMSF